MKKIQMFVITGAALCAVVVVGQSPVRFSSSWDRQTWSRTSHGFRIGTNSFLSTIERQSASSSPAWRTDAPLPVTIRQAEEIARTQLRTIVGDDAPWTVDRISLIRYGGAEHWYYTIEFIPPPAEGERDPKREWVTIVVDMAGRVGKIGPRE